MTDGGGAGSAPTPAMSDNRYYVKFAKLLPPIRPGPILGCPGPA